MRHKPKASFVIILSLTLSAIAQDDSEFKPGLKATYQSTSKTWHRIDSQVQFDWSDGGPTKSMGKQFTSQWRGRLEIPDTAQYEFYLFVSGKATLRINDAITIDANGNQASWKDSSKTTLARGHHSIELDYKTDGPAPQIGLFWKSDRFGLEPLSEQWFSHRQDPNHSAGSAGRSLARAFRCSACHRNDPSLVKAPSLKNLVINDQWLHQWLMKSDDVKPHSPMPSFKLSSAQATSVIRYLQGKSTGKTSSKAVSGNAKEGKALFQSIGCLGCHTVDNVGNSSLFGGGSLDMVGHKRSTSDLVTWLSAPAKLNANHRMPVFQLKQQERQDLALYLSSLKSSDLDELNGGPESSVEGKELIEQMRCAACHEIPGIYKSPSIEIKSWDNSCANPKNQTETQPNYALDDVQAHVLKSYYSAPVEKVSLSRLASAEHGRALLSEKNCLGCHVRGGSPGILPTLVRDEEQDKESLAKIRGELEPPALNSVGDKFVDRLLNDLVTGKGPVRRPWLKIRMPRFNHTDQERKALVNYFISTDRIPDHPDIKPQSIASSDAITSGQQLLSAAGFGCISCHTVGKHQPKGVAINARGSELLNMDKRIRHEWFVRWMKNPARIVPGMEMPAINVPIKGVLGDNVQHQLEALWQALNSDTFVLPSSRDSATNIVSLHDEDKPVVLRDVMFDCPPRSGWLPRHISIGLNNRTNVAFDLDRMNLRSWWLGDFARQRTEGKIWLWEPGGPPIWSTPLEYSGVALQTSSGNRIMLPVKKGQSAGRLDDWKTEANSVIFSYSLWFNNDVTVSVHEQISPVSHQKGQGFQRTISVTGVPGRLHPILLHSGPAKVAGTDLNQTAVLGRLLVRSQQPWFQEKIGETMVQTSRIMSDDDGLKSSFIYTTQASVNRTAMQPTRSYRSELGELGVIPGFRATRLPLPTEVMPSAIGFRSDATPVVTSLRGGVFVAQDTDGDGIEDEWQKFGDHFGAPFGILVEGDSVFVSHKPEILELRDENGDGRCDLTRVVATGWGFNDNYHDWTFGLVRGDDRRMVVVLGSDYGQKGRAPESTTYRGHALAINADGTLDDVARGLRFTAGIARNKAGSIFFTDNQGVQNTFNEINHLLPKSRYGVPGLSDPTAENDPWTLRRPVVCLPHPLTRSVNGICFLEADGAFGPFEGHGIGCEYDTRGLVRFSLQPVGDTFQGACYRLSLPEELVQDKSKLFLGPISCAISPRGELYIGSFRDSGWGGANNIGELIRVRLGDNIPTGIQEVQAFRGGFVIKTTSPIDKALARDKSNYVITSYRREWKGGYATPDSDRRTDSVNTVTVSEDGREITLFLKELRAGFVYDIHVATLLKNSVELWPSDAYYTLNQIPDIDASATFSETNP